MAREKKYVFYREWFTRDREETPRGPRAIVEYAYEYFRNLGADFDEETLTRFVEALLHEAHELVRVKRREVERTEEALTEEA